MPVYHRPAMCPFPVKPHLSLSYPIPQKQPYSYFGNNTFSFSLKFTIYVCIPKWHSLLLPLLHTYIQTYVFCVWLIFVLFIHVMCVCDVFISPINSIHTIPPYKYTTTCILLFQNIEKLSYNHIFLGVHRHQYLKVYN